MKRLIPLLLLLLLSTPAWGAIGTTPIQCVTDQSASRTSLDVDITATAGNFLTADAAVYNQNQNGGTYTLSLDAALTEEYSESAGGGFRAGGAAGWKVAAGGLESFTATITVDVGQWRFQVCEWASTGPGTPEVYASDSDTTYESNINTQESISGTASDTSAGVAFYLFHLNNTGQQWQAGRSYTNGTESVAPANENRPVTAIATETIDGSSTSRSSIFSTTSTGGRNVGGIMLAREVSAGSTTQWADNTVEPDGTQSMVGTITGNPLTQNTFKCEMGSTGQRIDVTANSSTTSGDCEVLRTMFQTGGDLDNTAIDVPDTAFLRGTIETTTPDTMTLTPSSNFGYMACDPDLTPPTAGACPLDSAFRELPAATYGIGDHYWGYAASGNCLISDEGVITAPPTGGVPCVMELRPYDDSLGQWGDMLIVNFEPPTEDERSRCKLNRKKLQKLIFKLMEQCTCDCGNLPTKPHKR